MGDNYRILLTFLRGCRGLCDRASWLLPRMTSFLRSLLSASISVAAAIKTKGHWPLANDFLEGDGGDAEARFGEGQRGVVMAFCRGLMLHPWR